MIYLKNNVNAHALYQGKKPHLVFHELQTDLITCNVLCEFYIACLSEDIVHSSHLSHITASIIYLVLLLAVHCQKEL